jgi:hypothetical protein
MKNLPFEIPKYFQEYTKKKKSNFSFSSSSSKAIWTPMLSAQPITHLLIQSRSKKFFEKNKEIKG